MGKRHVVDQSETHAIFVGWYSDVQLRHDQSLIPSAEKNKVVPKRECRKEETALADKRKFRLKGWQNGCAHGHHCHPSVGQYYSQSRVTRGLAVVSFIVCAYVLDPRMV